MDTLRPHSFDPDLQVLYDRLARALRATLPPPIDNAAENTGLTPDQALARRDTAAMAVVTSLAPADASEGALAVNVVIASARAAQCLQQLGQHPPVSDTAMKLRSQYTRHIQASLRSRSHLLTLQEARYTREAADAAARRESPQHSESQAAGDGLPTPSTSAAAPPAQLPLAPEETKPTAPRRSAPALRLIQGGLANRGPAG